MKRHIYLITRLGTDVPQLSNENFIYTEAPKRQYKGTNSCGVV
jgi:hypothetical protein